MTIRSVGEHAHVWQVRSSSRTTGKVRPGDLVLVLVKDFNHEYALVMSWDGQVGELARDRLRASFL